MEKGPRLKTLLALLACVAIGVEALAEEVDVNGIRSHRLESVFQGSETTVRVLLPDDYNADGRYRALYLLPVVAKDDRRFGDGLLEVQKHNLHNTHRLICVAPEFTEMSWFANHASDLRRREADIAIRNFRPTEPDLIAKKVGDADAVLYATPDYIERIGNPTMPQELQHAHFVNLDHGGMMIKGLNRLGLGLTEENFPLLTESYLVMWELVRQGAAIGILDAHIGDADPIVQRVLPDLEPLVFPIWLVSHRELTTSRRIRRVFDFLAEELHRG